MTSGQRLLAKVAPYAELIHGISHPHRLAILYILAHDPTWPEDIARHLPIPRPLIAHHMKEMVKAGWISKKRIGLHVTYSINKKALKALPHLLIDTPFWREHMKAV